MAKHHALNEAQTAMFSYPAAGQSATPRALISSPIVALAGLACLACIAVAVGYAATTANPLVIGSAIAVLAGAALLTKPSWIAWLTVTIGLLVVGLVPLWTDAAASKAGWGVSILGFCLLIAVFLHVATRSIGLKGNPRFIWLALIFMLYGAVNGLLQSATPIELIGGFKRYFSMFGLIFFFSWIWASGTEMRRWRTFILLVAIVQLPWAIYQRVELVPLRQGIAYAFPGMVPIDVVAGTFGSSRISGGSSAEMAAFLTIILGFIFSRARSGLISRPILFWLVPLAGTPLFLGETKIVLIIIPLILTIIYRRDFVSRPIIGLVAVSLGAIVVSALAVIYVHMTGMGLDRALRDAISYNFGNVGYGDQALNRTTVLTFWLDKQGLSDPVSAVFGNGIGSSNGSTIPPGHLAIKYSGMGIGLTAASVLLWEQGIVGFLLFISIFISAWNSAHRLVRFGRFSWIRADAAAVQAALATFLVWIVYRGSILESVPIQIMLSLSLGYLAWLCRQSESNFSIKA